MQNQNTVCFKIPPKLSFSPTVLVSEPNLCYILPIKNYYKISYTAFIQTSSFEYSLWVGELEDSGLYPITSEAKILLKEQNFPSVSVHTLAIK